MPTYDYRCTSCGFRFEEFQSIVSEPIKICPRCKGKVERVIGGGIGLIFKGSGFYLTDYKNSSNDAAESKEKPATDKTENGTSSPSKSDESE